MLTRGSTLVVRSRNKLDGRFYAVKKIKSRSASSLNDVLSEIIILSQLNHPYVVRYYNAWLEDETASPADQTAQVRVFHISSEPCNFRTEKIPSSGSVATLKGGHTGHTISFRMLCGADSILIRKLKRRIVA